MDAFNLNDYEIIDDVLLHYHGHEAYLTLPPGIRVIGEGAFRDCRELREVRLPEGLEIIGAEAFRWCSNLKAVHAPQSIHYVERDAFLGTPYYKYYCDNEIDWTDDFLFLGKCLIKARRNLRVAHIPEGTVSISDDAFNERVLLNDVHIPHSVVSIGWRAFSDCICLTQVHIPSSVRRIGWHCFKGCTRLREITFEEGVQTIENGAFSGCRSLFSITFPASLNELNSWMFFGCNNLRNVHFSGPIASIGDWTFSGCSLLTHVNLPEGITSIGVDAFYECITLKEVTFPKTLTEIKRRAFYGCRYIPEIHLPEHLNSLGDSAFFACRNVEKLILPGSLEEIPEDAFSCCDKLETLTIHPGVQTIGARAFADCEQLKIVSLPSTIKKMNAHAFKGCIQLKQLSFNPSTLTDLGTGVFDACHALADSNGFILFDQICYGYTKHDAHIILPENVHGIAASAFREKSFLRSLTASGPVSYVGNHAFCDCIHLEHLHLSNQVHVLPKNCLDGSDHLITLTTPGLSPQDLPENLRLPAALGYCQHPEYFSQNAVFNDQTPNLISPVLNIENAYNVYINANVHTLLTAAIDKNLIGAAAWFTREKHIPKDVFPSVLEYAQQKKSMEIIALLLDYRNKYLVQMNPFDSFEL